MDLQKAVWVEQQEILTQSLIANELNCRQLSTISHRNDGRKKPDQGKVGGGCFCIRFVLLPDVANSSHNLQPPQLFYLFHMSQNNFASLCALTQLHLLPANTLKFVIAFLLCFIFFSLHRRHPNCTLFHAEQPNIFLNTHGKEVRICQIYYIQNIQKYLNSLSDRECNSFGMMNA